MTEKVCQTVFDVKAFKGKGEAWKMLQAMQPELEKIWSEMEQFAQESNTADAPAYIQVHRISNLAKEGAVYQLRWRIRKHQQDSHANWDDVEPLLKGRAIAVRRYFWSLNQRMVDLNCQAGILRSIVLRLLARMEDKARISDKSPLFVDWVKGDISLANFDMRQPGYASTVRTQ